MRHWTVDCSRAGPAKDSMNSLGKVLPQGACQNATARIMKTIWNSTCFPLGVPTVSKFRGHTSWNCSSRIFYITLLHRSPNALTSLYSKGLQLTICEARPPGSHLAATRGEQPPSGREHPPRSRHPPPKRQHPPTSKEQYHKEPRPAWTSAPSLGALLGAFSPHI